MGRGLFEGSDGMIFSFFQKKDSILLIHEVWEEPVWSRKVSACACASRWLFFLAGPIPMGGDVMMVMMVMQTTPVLRGVMKLSSLFSLLLCLFLFLYLQFPPPPSGFILKSQNVHDDGRKEINGFTEEQEFLDCCCLLFFRSFVGNEIPVFHKTCSVPVSLRCVTVALHNLFSSFCPQRTDLVRMRSLVCSYRNEMTLYLTDGGTDRELYDDKPQPRVCCKLTKFL
mmetsp:Transcript_21051/g.54472  ORF Transcript_21051/g.54472 Transcript_21051/m.54472 type:complete len:226 (-) Transcript_21051:176-853(-)